MIGARRVLWFGVGLTLLVALAGFLVFRPVSADGPDDDATDDRVVEILKLMEEEVDK